MLADSDNCLTFSGKYGQVVSCTLAAMKQTGSLSMMIEENADFAVVGVFGGSVILEANEWDHVVGVYRVVTLYLRPEIARDLAEQLGSCANGADDAGLATL